MQNIILIIVLILFISIFIYLSSWFSGTETAITNLSNRRLAILRSQNEKNVRFLLRIKKRLPRTIVTLLIANNVVNIMLSSVTALLANRIFRARGVSITIGAVTFLLILFGEIVPKSKALIESSRMAQRRASLTYRIGLILFPFTVVFRWLSKQILKITGYKSSTIPALVSEESITSLAALGEEEGSIKHIERQIIDRVFIFGDRKVGDVMIPMNDVFVLKETERVDDVIDIIKDKGFSRIPLVDTKGMIRGILHVKDVILAERGIELGRIMRKAFQGKRNEDISVLFDKMRENGIHMVVVADEAKRCEGVITMEDILEELVGEIKDEFYEKKHNGGSDRNKKQTISAHTGNAERSKKDSG
jgi:putative hemolysin